MQGEYPWFAECLASIAIHRNTTTPKTSIMSHSLPPIAIVTAGAGGMFCGSCLNDNTLASALTRQGVDVQLIPTYTPIRTDDRDMSIDRVFFGGINVFLEQKSRLWGYVPRPVRKVLDHPQLIRWLTAGRIKTNAKLLGPLTISMLRGEAGRQRSDVAQIVNWLAHEMRPGLVQLTNLLIAGFVPALKKTYNVPVLVCLQGDDIFLNQLPIDYRSRALNEMRRLDQSIDGYLVHSDFYADFMSSFLSVSRGKFHRIPLGIQLDGFAVPPGNRVPESDSKSMVTIGYLARLAPEKGLHLLCEAFCQLMRRPGLPPLRLRVAGWLGPDHQAYADHCFQTVRDAGFGAALEYVGEVDRPGKFRFLQEADLLCVPSPYREPKGIYALEGLAAGLPIVVPDHGAFPEIVRNTGGGRLFTPNNVAALVDCLAELVGSPARRKELGSTGQAGVQQHHSAAAMASAAQSVYRQLLAK